MADGRPEVDGRRRRQSDHELRKRTRRRLPHVRGAAGGHPDDPAVDVRALGQHPVRRRDQRPGRGATRSRRRRIRAQRPRLRRLPRRVRIRRDPPTLPEREDLEGDGKVLREPPRPTGFQQFSMDRSDLDGGRSERRPDDPRPRHDQRGPRRRRRGDAPANRSRRRRRAGAGADETGPGPASYSSRSAPITGRDRQARRSWRRFRCGSSSTTPAGTITSPCWCHPAGTRPTVSPPASRAAAVPNRTGGDGSGERVPEVAPRSSHERPTTEHDHRRHGTVATPVLARDGSNCTATDPGPYDASGTAVVSPGRVIPSR